MAYLPIILSVRRDSWRMAAPMARGLGNAEDTRQQVLERDDHTCQFCGFRAQKYQELVPRAGDHADQRPESLVTACIFCQQCFSLEHVGAMRAGLLIWMPEISQAVLHHLARAIFVARRTQGPMAEAARTALDSLRARREEAIRRVGTDDPGLLAAVMQDLIEDREYDMRAKKLDGLRLLPLDRRIVKDGDLEFDQFPQILAYWRSKNGPFGGVMPASWPDLLKGAAEQLAAAPA